MLIAERINRPPGELHDKIPSVRYRLSLVRLFKIYGLCRGPRAFWLSRALASADRTATGDCGLRLPWACGLRQSCEVRFCGRVPVRDRHFIRFYIEIVRVRRGPRAVAAVGVGAPHASRSPEVSLSRLQYSVCLAFALAGRATG